MNANKSTSPLTATDQAAVDEWCKSVRAMHSLYGRPIEDGDPRLEELRTIRPQLTNLSPEELGDLYWWRADFDLPAWPLPLPQWVVSSEISRHNYPEIGVELSGTDWLTASPVGGTCRITQFVTVFVEAGEVFDGETRGAGTVLLNPPRIYVQFEEELSAEDALTLSEALANAGRELAAS